MLRTMLRSVQTFLLDVSGTDRPLLREIEGHNPTSHSRQVRAGLGAVILLTFIVTWASSAWTATTFGVGVYAGGAVGLLVGLIKMAWDRRVAVAATTKMAWTRMVAALPISLILALPLALALFGDYTTDVSKEDDREAIVDAYQKDAAERKALEAEIDSLRRGQRFFQTMASAEVGGLTQEEAGLTDDQLQRYGVEPPSGTPPCGPRCTTYKQRAGGYRSALKAKKNELQALPSRKELTTRRNSALEELEQETTDAVTLLGQLYQTAFQRPIIGLLFLVLVATYAFVDLLPAIERVFAADLYTKIQLARINHQKKKREIEQAQKQGELRRKRAATWIEAKFFNRILEEADSEDVSLKELQALMEMLDELGEQDIPSGPCEASRSRPSTGRDAAAGDGAPASGAADFSGSPESSMRLRLPPANGWRGG